LSRTEPDGLWVALPRKQEAVVQAMFRASVTVQIGMGNAALFWRDRWLDGSAIAGLAPDVCAAVSPRVRRARTVAEALVHMQWIRDISGSLSTQALSQFVALWECNLLPPSKTVLSGNGQPLSSTQLPRLIERFFMGSVACRGRGRWLRLARRRAASFSFGSPCLIGAGHRHASSVIISRTVALAFSAVRPTS
jgi:hypothetical protein